MKNTALTVAGIVFLIVAAAHALRILYGIDIVIAGRNIPVWPSSVAFVISIALTIWMFVVAGKKE